MNFLILLILISLPVFSSETCQDPTQDMQTIDGIAMPKGPLKGQCVATNEGRPVEEIERSENTLIVKNVSHNSGFVVAKINLDDIQDAIFQLEKFPPEWLAAHTQLRIRFKSESVKLAASEEDLDNGKLISSTKDLIVTNEALGVKGFVYALVPGAMDNYLIATRITTLQEKIRIMIHRDHHTVKQFLLNLTPDEITELLIATIYKAKNEAYSVMYNTLKKNCATDIFKLIDDSLKTSTPQRNISNFYETLSFLPIIAPNILKDSGLLEAPFQDLNDEIKN